VVITNVVIISPLREKKSHLT